MNFIKQLFAVGIGGMIGAMGRYGVSLLFTDVTNFPFATLTVNMIGCFLLSYLLNNSYLKAKLHQNIFTALGTGLIGSFTTFSTFATETNTLFQTSIPLAFLYIMISIIVGLMFCYMGYQSAYKRWERQ